ncbi:MAG TPA: hypothetical protein VN436_09965, partial [Holophaga sp.]|nr:hypothetical protein [Holophaga sp.]
MSHPKRDFSHLVRRHPCMAEGPGPRTGRLHLPVSPACNLACRYCLRTFNEQEERPGVSRGILDIADVLGVLERALA